MKNSVMRLLFLSTLLTIFSTGCSDNPIETPSVDPAKKIIHIEEKWYEPGDMPDTLMYGYRAEYNRDGKPLDKKSFARADGKLHLQTIYKYDENGHAIEETQIQTRDSIIHQQLFENKYDKSGQKISMLRTVVQDNAQFEHFFTYYDDGSYDEAIKYQSKDFAFKKYNADGKILINQKFDNNSKITQEFDEHGEILKKIMTMNDKVIQTSDYINEYNDAGELVSVTLGYRKRTYEYNDNGDIVKESWYKNGILDRTIHYKYTYYE